METEPTPQFTIEEMTEADIEFATVIRLQSWLDTYVNDEIGVSKEWIEQRNVEQTSDDKIKSRLERFRMGKKHGTFNAWVAHDKDNKIIGSTTPFQDEDGTWHVGSLYVDKKWHGAGVGGALMSKAMSWMGNDKDIYLGVVAYNERAKAFYRKWGFVEVKDSKTLFAGKIPEVMMVRRNTE